jgi:hypothetical protein
MVITDNPSSHASVSTRTWLVDHPRIQHAFLPKGGLLAESAGGLVAAVSPPGPCRPVVRHYERLPDHHQAMVQWAMITIMTRRLARQHHPALTPTPALARAA